MAISEQVRLIIEVDGSRQASRAVRQLDKDTQALRGTFNEAGADIALFQQRLRANFTELRTFLKATSTDFRTAASGLVIPASAVKQNKAAADQITESLGRVRKESKKVQSQFTSQNEITKRANLLFIDTGRGIQDLSFGFRAVVNNLDPIILNYERFTKAVADGNNGIATATVKLKALFGVLATPAGLLLLINVLFTIANLTGLLDPVGDFFGKLFGNLFGINSEAKKFQKSIESSSREARRLGEDLTFKEAQRALEEIDATLDDITSQSRLDFFQRIGLSIATIGVGEGSDFAAFLRQRGAELDDLAELLEERRKVIQERVGEIQSELLTLSLGDPRIVSQRQATIVKSIRDQEQEILRIRARGADESIATQARIAQLETDQRIEALERQRRLVVSSIEIIEEERRQALVRTQRGITSELRQQNRLIVENFTRSFQLLLQQIGVFDRQIEAEQAATNANILRRFREIRRAVEDAQTEVRLLQAQTATLGVRSERERVNAEIALIELETEAREVQLRRQLDDFKGGGRERAKFEAAIQGQITEFRARGNREAAVLREELLNSEADQAEQRIRLEEEVQLQRGGLEELVIRRRISRLSEELAVFVGTEARKRSLIDNRIELEGQLGRIIFQRQADERTRLNRQIEGERKLGDALRQIALETAQVLGLKTQDAIRQTITVLNAELILARDAASSIGDIQDEITNVQARILDAGEAEAVGLAQQLLQLEFELDQAEDSQKRILEIIQEIAQAERDLLKEQKAVFDERVAIAEDFARQIVSVLFEAFEARRQISNAEVALQRDSFRIEEQQLALSLKNRELAEGEANVRLRALRQSRSDFERKVEQDRLNLAERVGQGIVNIGRQTAQEILADLSALAVRSIATAFFAAQASKAIVVPTMATIAASAGPAATLTSIATFGASAVTGQTAVAAALLANRGLVASLLQGFSEGGFTGHGGRDAPAGIVHRGEFVVPAWAVGNDPQPFYGLIRAIREGYDPAALLGLSSFSGRGLLGSAGFGYQSGGLVSASSFLGAPRSQSRVAPGGNLDDLLEENHRLRLDFERLAFILENQGRRSATLVVDSRQARRLSDEGVRAAKVVNP